MSTLILTRAKRYSKCATRRIWVPSRGFAGYFQTALSLGPQPDLSPQSLQPATAGKICGVALLASPVGYSAKVAPAAGSERGAPRLARTISR